MKITSIKAQVKNENRVSVFVDEKYTFSLTLDQLLDEKIKKGDELDELRLKELKKLSDEGKLRQRALEWVMGRPHSTRELRDYLYKKKIEKEHIEQLVEDFTEKNYLNDSSFAKWFAENRLRKNKSSRAIISELMSKGIARDVALQVVNELEVSDDESLATLVKKLRTRTRYKDDQKLKTYLISKGFNYGSIKQAVENES